MDVSGHHGHGGAAHPTANGDAREAPAGGGKAGRDLEVLTASLAALLPVAGVGVLVREGDTVTSATAPDRRVDVVHRLQVSEPGPGLEALQFDRTVLVADLAAEAGRWPRFHACAASVGLVAVVSLPVSADGTTIASLTLYHDEVRDWTVQDLRVARLAAKLAASHLVHTSLMEAAQQRAAQLQGALDSRIVIEQAKGVIAGEQNISVDEAFELLRSHARAHRVSLHSIAVAVVKLGVRP